MKPVRSFERVLVVGWEDQLRATTNFIPNSVNFTKMWYEIIPSLAAVTTFLGVPTLLIAGIHKIAYNNVSKVCGCLKFYFFSSFISGFWLSVLWRLNTFSYSFYCRTCEGFVIRMSLSNLRTFKSSSCRVKLQIIERAFLTDLTTWVILINHKESKY